MALSISRPPFALGSQTTPRAARDRPSSNFRPASHQFGVNSGPVPCLLRPAPALDESSAFDPSMGPAGWIAAGGCQMLMKAASVPALQRRSWTGALQRTRAAPWMPYVASLASVAAITVLLHVADTLFDLEHVAFAYLVPVIVAATRWGVMPAVFSGVAGAAASAFFFYPPL